MEEEKKTENWRDIKWKCRYEQVKAKAKEKTSNFWTWCGKHPITAITLASITADTICKVSKNRHKVVTEREERRLKEMFIYDRRKGHYVETRRRLRPSEWAEYDKLYSEGWSATEILQRMRLLK